MNTRFHEGELSVALNFLRPHSDVFKIDAIQVRFWSINVVTWSVILNKSSRISSKRDLKNVNPILGGNRWQLSTNFRVEGHDVKHWEEIGFRSTRKDVWLEEDQDTHLKYSPGWNRRRCYGEVEVRLLPRNPHRSS